ENYELRADLNSEYRDRRKDAIKRVIANMTVGKMCSRTCKRKTWNRRSLYYTAPNDDPDDPISPIGSSNYRSYQLPSHNHSQPSMSAQLRANRAALCPFADESKSHPGILSERPKPSQLTYHL
ncbi:12863_t:CDS:2, partial [Acaulospora colombiana]